MPFDSTAERDKVINRIALRFFRDEAFVTDVADHGHGNPVFSNGRRWIYSRAQRRQMWADNHSLAEWMVDHPDLNAAHLHNMDRGLWAEGEAQRIHHRQTARRIEKAKKVIEGAA